MTYFVQQLLNGIGTGAIYASLALALVLVYRITNIANFGQGEMATFSAFLAWQFHHWGFPLGLAILTAVIVSCLIGALVYFFLMRPVQYKDELTIVIVTIGIFLVFNSASGATWGFLQKPLPSMFPSGSLNFGAVRISYELIGSLATLGLIAFALYVLFQRTRLGIAFRAAASSPESSQLIGVPYALMVLIGWALAGGIGAISGALVAPRLTLDPNMMQSVLIYAFAGAVVGGLTSYQGAVVGGLLVGIAQSMSIAFLPALGSDLQIVVPLVLIVAVLALKPEGIFGRAQVVRV